MSVVCDVNKRFLFLHFSLSSSKQPVEINTMCISNQMRNFILLPILECKSFAMVLFRLLFVSVICSEAMKFNYINLSTVIRWHHWLTLECAVGHLMLHES